MYLHRINNKRFTVRLCTAAKFNGFKTVGKFKKFLEQNERVKLPAAHTMKSSKLLEELNEYLTPKVKLFIVRAMDGETLIFEKIIAINASDTNSIESLKKEPKQVFKLSDDDIYLSFSVKDIKPIVFAFNEKDCDIVYNSIKCFE